MNELQNLTAPSETKQAITDNRVKFEVYNTVQQCMDAAVKKSVESILRFILLDNEVPAPLNQRVDIVRRIISHENVLSSAMGREGFFEATTNIRVLLQDIRFKQILQKHRKD